MNPKHGIRWIWAGILLAIILMFLAVLADRAYGQSSCPEVTIRNDSIQTIDTQAICDAARPFFDKNIQVYVYLTDRNPQTEDEWFAVLDEVQNSFGVYDLRSEIFTPSAFVVQATTITNHPWGQNLTLGDDIYYTPLGENDRYKGLNGQLKASLANGQMAASDAIVSVIQRAAEIAYPPVVVAPAVQVQPTPKQTTPAPKPKADFGWVVWVIVVVACGGATIFVAPKAFHAGKLAAHIDNLQDLIRFLIAASDQLIAAETAQESTLYQLWQIRGGGRYPEQDSALSKKIADCQEVLIKAQDVYKSLSATPVTKGIFRLHALTKQWEILFLILNKGIRMLPKY